MEKNYDAIIIGSGIIGCSIAFELSKLRVDDPERGQAVCRWQRIHIQYLCDYQGPLLNAGRHSCGL